MRDTYSDYVTSHDLSECRNRWEAEEMVSSVRDHLGDRSGSLNVTNATLHIAEDFAADAIKMRISFDSRAWTGRA